MYGKQSIIVQYFFLLLKIGSRVFRKWLDHNDGALKNGISATGSQLVALFGKIMEPLGGGALLEEVWLWGQTLWFYSLACLPDFVSISWLPGWSYTPAAMPSLLSWTVLVWN